MGYYKYLKDMLFPLHVYNFDAGYSNAELLALGTALDSCALKIAHAERECCAATAEDIGLMNFEKIMPYNALYNNLQQRREHLCALISVNEETFSVKKINNILQACGANAHVAEGEKQFTVCISFPGQVGLPDDFDSVKSLAELLLPCHLEIEYIIAACTWNVLESAFETWDNIEDANMTFKTMESYNS